MSDPVKVTVQAHYNWLNFLSFSGALPSIGADITSTATMRLEKNYFNDSTKDAYTASGATGTCP